MKIAELFEASLGSRFEFTSRKDWENALPPKHTLHKDGALERAQALGKDFEGVAGTWNFDKNVGWIYTYYLKKSNLVEASVDDDDDDEDKWLTPLKDLSKHVWHAQIFVNGDDADKALNSVHKGGEGDVLIWHDWESHTTYRVELSSTTKQGIKNNVERLKKALPRAHIFVAYKDGGTIQHRDWRDYSSWK